MRTRCGLLLVVWAWTVIAACAQTTTLRVQRVAIADDLIIGTATFSPTSPLQVVGLPALAGAIGIVDGSGNIGTASSISQDVDPTANYMFDIGQLNKKWLTLHAAELWVETLVAQETLATIGGRILVGPTTTLTSDLASDATSIVVKHNNLASGDRVYLEVNGAVEFMAVTSGASGVGPYTYSVTRNLDGSGANTFSAGDAVFNTGAAGDGFIDLYSLRGVKSDTEIGPTIVGNVRTGTGYVDWAPRWAIGNLYGVYGYGATTYGFAAGDPDAIFVTVDASVGIRMMDGSTNPDTVKAQWHTDGTITIGSAATNNSGRIVIDSNSLDFDWRNNAGALATIFQLRNVGGAGDIYTTATISASGAIYARGDLFSDNGTDLAIVNTSAAAHILLEAGAGAGNLKIDALLVNPVDDSQTTLGTSALRWQNINMDLPENTSPAYVVVSKGAQGGGGDSLSALGYIVGITGDVVLKGSDGNNCTLTFKSGVLYAETCP